jgi:hypothetical protein
VTFVLLLLTLSWLVLPLPALVLLGRGMAYGRDAAAVPRLDGTPADALTC